MKISRAKIDIGSVQLLSLINQQF